MRRLVILRPEPGAGQTLARAKARGWDAVSVPLFEVEAIEWSAPDPAAFDGLLVTSANAVRQAGSGLQRLRSLPAYAVGDATAQALRDAGFDVAASGQGGVDALLSARPTGLRLLHLAGEDRREPSSSPHEITPVVVYRSVPIEQPTGLDALTGAVTLVHSPRAGQRLAEIVPDRERTMVAAISPAAAAACGSGWERIAACESPDDEALLSLAERLCKTPARP
ncbi:uroporphyrinogen-III synthase [Sphingomonas arenae]|uniref:uroporphyrinogen-III synthase n=1 Tax=Sphingomonas arenae TaxID=2812555 RepID=UPI001967FED5|nr:uroporphyrinogen-III synthase [Sphingomonas arenae]